MTITINSVVRGTIVTVIILALFIVFSGTYADAAACANRANRTPSKVHFGNASGGGVSAGGVFGEIVGSFRR